MKIIILLVASLLFSGCSSNKLNLSGHVREYGDLINVTVTGVDAAISKKLERRIKSGLISRGFEVSSEKDITRLEVNISTYDTGNAALRVAIGFGSGRGSLIYKAQYIKGEKILVDYDGNEHFTGMEILPGTTDDPMANFGGEETSERILLEEATKHIVDLALIGEYE